MPSRLRARSLRFALAAVVFVVMLGIRIGLVPDDDDDPIVDYGPQLSSPLPARRLGALAADVPAATPGPGERTVLHRPAAHHFRMSSAHRRPHAQAPDSD